MTENENRRPGLKLTNNYYRPSGEPADAQAREKDYEAESSCPLFRKSLYAKKDSARLRRHRVLVLTGWPAFVLLAGALIYARFFAGIPGLDPALLKKCGTIAVGIVYLISILLALKDNMFDGLLALAVPFYPFYYLFFSSGSILFRILTAALLAAFGYDCLTLLQNLTLGIFARISYWMEHV